ncbi:MAG TPA: ABC transporter permease subunit, partial [Planctomycetota bacterium]|nr:ABC transporter permease subunit [Planctomycetota bacterium]
PVLLVHAFTLYPLFFAFTTSGLDRLDRGLLDAARTLGATPSRAFAGVALPALLPSLAAAAALTFMSSMASFTAPYVFGAGSRTLTVAIVVARQDDAPDAAALSILLLLASLLSLAPLAFLPTRGVRGSKGAAAVAEESLASRAARGAVGALVAAAVAAPLAAILLLSFKRRGRLGDEALFDDLVLDHYRAALSGLFDPRASGAAAGLAAAVGRSLLYAALATAVGTVVALLVAAAKRVAPRTLRGLLDAAAMLPFAAPGTVVALALLEEFSTHGLLGFGGALAGTATILPLAYFVRNLPIHLRATEAALDEAPKDVADASRTLGRGPVGTALHAVLPGIAAGVVAGALLAFVTASGEFVASVLLAGVFTKPASVAVYEAFGGASFGPAAAAGTLLSAAAALAALLLRGLVALAFPSAPRRSR